MGDGLVARKSWRVASGSVQGSGHEKAGVPCQDAHGWSVARGDVLVLAVADGAGSAPLASDGSTLAVRTAVDFLTGRLKGLHRWKKTADETWAELITAAAKAAYDSLTAEANTRSVSLHDFATTLIVAVAGEDFLAGIQVGDGAIVVEDSGGAVRCVAQPAQGEYLNETLFLTSRGAVAGARPEVWRGPLAHAAVLSDGLQMLALRMPGAEPHSGFFKPLFRFLDGEKNAQAASQQLQSFLASARVRERTDDDVTLVVASLAGRKT